QSSNPDGIAPLPHDAEALALELPRADSARARGQGVPGPIELDGAGQIPFGEEVDEVADGIAVGAPVLAGGRGALEAPLGLQDRLFVGVPLVDLSKGGQPRLQRQLAERDLIPPIGLPHGRASSSRPAPPARVILPGGRARPQGPRLRRAPSAPGPWPPPPPRRGRPPPPPAPGDPPASGVPAQRGRPGRSPAPRPRRR